MMNLNRSRNGRLYSAAVSYASYTYSSNQFRYIPTIYHRRSRRIESHLKLSIFGVMQ